MALTIHAMEGIDRALLTGTPQQVDRRFALLRRENDLRNVNMLTAIAKTKTVMGSIYSPSLRFGERGQGGEGGDESGHCNLI